MGGFKEIAREGGGVGIYPKQTVRIVNNHRKPLLYYKIHSIGKVGGGVVTPSVKLHQNNQTVFG